MRHTFVRNLKLLASVQSEAKNRIVSTCNSLWFLCGIVFLCRKLHSTVPSHSSRRYICIGAFK